MELVLIFYLPCQVLEALLWLNIPLSVARLIEFVPNIIFLNLVMWSRVYLAGQSAGAHLATCALLMQAEKEITQDPAKLSWRSSQLNACMLISGG